MTSEKRAMHSSRWIYPYDIPVLSYCLIALLFSLLYDFRIDFGIVFNFNYDIHLIKITIPIIFVYLAVRVRRHGGNSSDQLKFLYSYLKKFMSPTGLPAGLIMLYEFFRAVLAIKLCLVIYTHLKQEIPVLNPNLYDEALWRIDRWVHLGISPVHISLRHLSTSWSALLIDWLYAFWYVLKAPFLLYFIWVAKNTQRMHFLTCYLLLWMIGGAFAIVFPSLGPVYTNPELFEHLNTPTAHRLQGMLWQHYQQLLTDPSSYKIYIYEGIAAFPSLHVAMAVLFTIAIKEHRWAFRLMALYSLLIQIGSVLLGWHYAVDGYFGALLAIGIFYATRELWPELKGETRSDSQQAGEKNSE
ncbi:MAG: phosphatase PAP2 family protein [Desulfobacteraceae bacterium]